ncbi:MAG: response regulator [Elusimicrobiota bacterium]
MALDRMVKKLLFIEDELYVIERVCQMVKKYEDIKIEHVSDAKVAREKLLLLPYDIVITDAFIYGLTALEVNKLAHDKNPDVCVIVICQNSTMDIASKSIKEGAFDYVLKPQDIEKIESLLKLYFLAR